MSKESKSVKGQEMNASKTKSAVLAIGGAALITSGYFALRKYLDHRQLKSELDCIPWDLPEEHTSWKLRFSARPIVKTTRYRIPATHQTHTDSPGHSLKTKVLS